MKWVAAVALLGTAAVWAWALTRPSEEPVPLPERLAGEYQLFRFEPAPEMTGMGNPFPPGQAVRFDFDADGTYRIRILVAGGFEMARTEGFLRHDAEGSLTLDPELRNGIETEDPPDTFRVRWVHDDRGEVLLLTHATERYEYYLRRAAASSGR